MNNYILALVGQPRTATSSIWRTLSKHENIARSRMKEPMNRSHRRFIYPRGYLDEFLINENTKVLLDATPGAYYYYFDRVKRIKEQFKDIRIIYFVRKPQDRLYSAIKMMVIARGKNINININYPEFIINSLKIRKDKVSDVFHILWDSIHLEHAYMITDKVFITRFDNIILEDIFNFLEVEPIPVSLNKSNEMLEWNMKIYDKVRIDVDSVFLENRQKINEMILDDLIKIRDKVYVEDWIDETKNILSHV